MGKILIYTHLIEVDGRYKHLVLSARAINNQLEVVRIEAATFTIRVIHAYAPTSAVPNEDIKEFYSILEETLASLPRSDINLVLEDCHGLGTRNEHRAGLLQFCMEQQLVLANTLLQQHNRRLYK